MKRNVSLSEAMRIGRAVFDIGLTPEVGDFSYTFVCGIFKLQIMKDCQASGQVYCRLEAFTGMIGKSLGYFYFCLDTSCMSPIRAED